MRRWTCAALGVLLIASAGCGVFYQAGTRLRAAYMSESLEPGLSTLEVRNRWGEPDIRHYPDERTQIWSYAYKPNTDDVTAALLYTSARSGDRGTFLDLKFVDAKLVSWSEAEHTMPAKAGESVGYGLAGSSTPLGTVR